MHVPSQPLMRPPLSRFPTPADPRRAVGFFRFGSSLSCLFEPITQPTSDRGNFHFRQPFQPSTKVKLSVGEKKVTAVFRCREENFAVQMWRVQTVEFVND